MFPLTLELECDYTIILHATAQTREVRAVTVVNEHVPAPRAEGNRQKAITLVLLCAAQFMVILDTTIVNVALPSIGADLDLGGRSGLLQYVISLYALTFGGSLILAGRAADLFGRRRLFVIGLVAFALASLACGLASTPGLLLTGRALQGLAAALASSSALSLLTTIFDEGAERNRALGAWGAVGGAAGASGLIIGGAITDLLGWPWIFLLNLPIGLGVAVAAMFRLSVDAADQPQRMRRLDLPGAITVTGALGLLVFGLTRSQHDGLLTASTVGLLAGAVVLLAIHILIERRVHHPLVAFRLFRLPGVAGANLTALLLTTIVASNLFFTTLYVQGVLGYSPLQTGFAFLPNSMLVVVGSALASRLLGRIGEGPILASGFTILAVASLLLTGISPDGAYLTDVLPGFALTGLGLGLAIVAVTGAATRGVDSHDHGLASGVVNTAQQVGFAVGIAAIVAAASAVTESGGMLGAVQQVSGYAFGYLIDAVIAAVAALLAIFLVRRKTTRCAGLTSDHERASRTVR